MSTAELIAAQGYQFNGAGRVHAANGSSPYANGQVTSECGLHRGEPAEVVTAVAARVDCGSCLRHLTAARRHADQAAAAERKRLDTRGRATVLLGELDRIVARLDDPELTAVIAGLREVRRLQRPTAKGA